MPTADDLSPFFDVDEFAVEATIDYVPVKGIFSNGYAEAFGAVATAAPRFSLPTADAASVTQGDVLRIVLDGNTVAYSIRSVEPDGTGLTRLTLHLQS